jgi:hypothetical protein
MRYSTLLTSSSSNYQAIVLLDRKSEREFTHELRKA